jgi:hypothetical protein
MPSRPSLQAWANTIAPSLATDALNWMASTLRPGARALSPPLEGALAKIVAFKAEKMEGDKGGSRRPPWCAGRQSRNNRPEVTPPPYRRSGRYRRATRGPPRSIHATICRQRVCCGLGRRIRMTFRCVESKDFRNKSDIIPLDARRAPFRLPARCLLASRWLPPAQGFSPFVRSYSSH